MFYNIYGMGATSIVGVCFHPSVVGWAAIWKFLRAHSKAIESKPDLSTGEIKNVKMSIETVTEIKELVKDFNDNPLKYELWRQSFLEDIVVEVDGRIVDPSFSWEWFAQFERFLEGCETFLFNPEE